MLTDPELVCLAAAQALLGFTSEAHWLRYARKHLAGMFPYLPQQSGYNKRLRASVGLVRRVIRLLARSTDFWLDNCWIADSTPVPCGMSWPAVQRSELAGWGYCASHSRFFWGLRLYLVCTPAGMPILWADPKLGEREVLAAMLEVEADVLAGHEGILLITDKGFAGRDFEQLLVGYSITLLRQASSSTPTRAARSTPRPPSAQPASGFPSASRWVGPAPPSTTPSSSPGTPPSSSSSARSSTLPPGPRPGARVAAMAGRP